MTEISSLYRQLKGLQEKNKELHEHVAVLNRIVCGTQGAALDENGMLRPWAIASLRINGYGLPYNEQSFR